jgi:hypothetical protein
MIVLQHNCNGTAVTTVAALEAAIERGADRVFLFTRWTLRTVPLRAVPSVVRVGAYTAFRLVGAVRLLMPVPITVIA